MSYLDTPDERALMRKVTLRLLPFLFFLYIIAYLDRVNVGFAKLQMNQLPWFSENVFGAGAGIFFLGYFLFEVPSNLLLQRIGARLWIARIMITWGIIAMSMCLARDAASFYTLRFLLGLAEAGFFPGVLLYMTYWFTARERARVVALFMTANAVAYIFGGPISGLLLQMHGLWGLAGWQALFVLEGMPAVLLAFVVLAYLPNGPESARWLSDTERHLLRARLARAAATVPPTAQGKHDTATLSQALRHPTVWLLCLIYFLLVAGMYGISLWLPQIIQSLGKKSDLMVGLLTAIPYLTAGVVMVVNGWHSDQTGERRWHVAIPAAFGTLGLAACALSSNPFLSLACISVAAAGMWATLGPFWSFAPGVLRGASAIAGGIALINSVGNLGGFVGPFAVGWIKTQTGGFTAPLLTLAGAVAAGGLCALFAPRPAPAGAAAPESVAAAEPATAV